MNDSNIEETLVVSKKIEGEPEVKLPKILKKDGVAFTLSDPIMISAFENQGYEVEE
mgnify:CR=1 FL=1|jgi:hypothetical protein